MLISVEPFNWDFFKLELKNTESLIVDTPIYDSSKFELENLVECISDLANVDYFNLDVSKLEFYITENLKSSFSKLTFEKFTLFKTAY